MDVLPLEKYQELLSYLPTIKSSLKEWQLVEIRLMENAGALLTSDQVVRQIHTLFRDKEGKIFTGGNQEIFMLIRWGRSDPFLIPMRIEAQLPAGTCKVTVREPTEEGLGKLEILIQAKTETYANKRKARWENVILVADDDMYMRMLVKKGSGATAIVHEVGHGDEILPLYKQHAPDIVFLDIHMPGQNGLDVLMKILGADPTAYIVMLSSDSSAENVKDAIAKGAKGFLTKPFTKEKLVEHLKKCPTYSAH